MASFNLNTQNWCSSCGKGKALSSFIQSLNENHKNFLPFCKTCVNAKLRQYKEETGSDGGALYCVCAELGYPMIREYFDIAVKLYAEKGNNQSNNNLFVCYHNTLKDLGFIVKGFWQSDMDLSEFIDFGEDKEEQPKKLVDYDELQRKWGRFSTEDGLDTEAYEFLEFTYEDYTKDLLDMDTNLERRYRDLAKCELRLRRANESGDGAEISKAQEALNKQLALLKMNDFESTFKSEEQKFFEKRIAMVEHYKPAECEDLTRFLDKVGYEKDRATPMRSLRNAIAGSRDYPDIPKEEV